MSGAHREPNEVADHSDVMGIGEAAGEISVDEPMCIPYRRHLARRRVCMSGGPDPAPMAR